MENKVININENDSIIINYELEDGFKWANVYLKKNGTDTYLGYYAPELLGGFLQWIEFNPDYILFFTQNIHSSKAYISAAYDINNDIFIDPDSLQVKKLELKKV